MARQVIDPNFFKKKTVPVSPAPSQAPSETVVPAKKSEQVSPKQPHPATGRQTTAKPQAPVNQPPRQENKAPQKQEKPKTPVKTMIRLGHKTAVAMNEAMAALQDCSQSNLSASVEKILKDVGRNRFTVAVVGEFNRGKSTFINRLLGKEVVPTGNLPTTALLTRIRYNPKDVLVAFDEMGQKRKSVVLEESAWDELVADNFTGNDPKGSVLVGIESPWLLHSGIELMDTPGAGDLEENRTRVISDALLKADAAVIAVSAMLPLSMSEKLFIEERLIAHKTPFMMMIITKMDQIPVSRRNDMLDYIHDKLAQWELKIPVFIPADLELPDDKYQSIVGMDRVKAQLEAWVRDPQRVSLTEGWVASRAADVLSTGISSLQERLCLLDADEDKRQNLIDEKKKQLEKAQGTWEDLRSQMRDRSENCYARVSKRAEEYTATITERLQYEASHAANPEKWWKEDYPYRLKVELTNMSAGINDTASRIISEDTAWFNRSLDKSFKTYVLTEKGSIVDKERFVQISTNKNVQMENVDGKRSATRLAISAVSIAGALAMNMMGMGQLTVLSTLGVNTGGNVVSDLFFKKKLGQQREELKAAIGQDVPQMIQEAVSESRKRVKEIYGSILNEAVEKEKIWQESQSAAIESSFQGKNTEQRKKLASQLARLQEARNRLLNV